MARIASTQENPRVFDTAIVVADNWQQRGIGGYLLGDLLAGASSARLQKVTATTLAMNEGHRSCCSLAVLAE